MHYTCGGSRLSLIIRLLRGMRPRIIIPAFRYSIFSSISSLATRITPAYVLNVSSIRDLGVNVWVV